MCSIPISTIPAMGNATTIPSSADARRSGGDAEAGQRAVGDHQRPDGEGDVQHERRHGRARRTAR